MSGKEGEINMKTQDEIDKACQLIVQRLGDYLWEKHRDEIEKLYADALIFGLTEDDIKTRMEQIFAANK